MSNLIHHAQNELRAIGMLDSGDEMNQAMAQNILELVEVFSKQGHSGFSANYAVAILSQLLSYKPLAPITGADAEWHDVSDVSGEPMWQNKRASFIFKGADGRAYDIDAVVDEYPDGSRVTRGGERQYIEFPYTPKTDVVMVDEAGEVIA